jgi:hypothetical protein
VEEKSTDELLEIVGGSVEGAQTVVLVVYVDDSIQETIAAGSKRLHAAELQIVH